jgi:hypothetical protein
VLAAKGVKEKLERKKRSQEKDYARFQPNLNLPKSMPLIIFPLLHINAAHLPPIISLYISPATNKRPKIILKKYLLNWMSLSLPQLRHSRGLWLYLSSSPL